MKEEQDTGLHEQERSTDVLETVSKNRDEEGKPQYKSFAVDKKDKGPVEKANTEAIRIKKTEGKLFYAPFGLSLKIFICTHSNLN